MKTATLMSVGMILVILIAGSIFFLTRDSIPNDNQQQETQNTEEKIIGGDKDEYGCLGSAGYSWCEAKQTCLRIWEESCDDSILALVDEIKNETGVELGNSEETDFDWRVKGEDKTEILKLTGLKFSKNEVSSEEYNSVARYFEDNYQTNLENVAGGVMGGLAGYISNYDVCLLGYEFTRSEKSPEGPIIPDTSSRQMTLTCGWLDKSLLPQISDEKLIKELFAEKYNKKVSTIDLTIQQQVGDYARGSVKFWDEARTYGEGGIWLAYKTGKDWNLAFDGNGMFDCQTMQDLGFSQDLIEGCYAGE